MLKNEKQPHATEYAFQMARLCGAKTRKGTACKSPAVHEKNRCRMHGGAVGSGAPIGNQNAFKHGYYTSEAISLRKTIKKLLKEMRSNIAHAGSDLSDVI